MTEDKLRALRLKYNAAYAAYQSCVMAMNEAAFKGIKPSQDLLDGEAAALRDLTEARGALLAAMAEFERDAS